MAKNYNISTLSYFGRAEPSYIKVMSFEPHVTGREAFDVEHRSFNELARSAD
jgi:hypothetical protein